MTAPMKAHHVGGIMEYVIVVEERNERLGVSQSGLAFVSVARMTARVVGGVRVHRGQWSATRADTLAFLFSDLDHAKRVWRTAAVLQKLRSVVVGPYTIRIHAVMPEPERTGRWTRKRLGPEVWPRPHDPVGLLATIVPNAPPS
jgi:hypothetical protein